MEQPIVEGPAATEEAATPLPEAPAPDDPIAAEPPVASYTPPQDMPDMLAADPHAGGTPPWLPAETEAAEVAPPAEPVAEAQPAPVAEADTAALQDKDAQIQQLQGELALRDATIQTLAAQEARQEESIASFQTQIIQKDVEIKDLIEKLADMTGQFQRLSADFENHRRRTTQERENLVKFAGERVITNLLPIFDNFGRAMQAANAIDTQVLLKGIEAMVNQIKGLDMIRRQLDDLMQKSGVAAIQTIGEIFDPNLHEAVMLEDTTEHPDQTILGELQSGYTLSGKVIRAAMVKVANNPAGTVAAPTAEPAAPAAEPVAEANAAEPAATTAVESGGWDQISQGLGATEISLENVPTEESET